MSCSKPKRPKSSSLWIYFTIIDDNNKTCRCELCGLVLSYRSTINNLKKHIERRHVTINLHSENNAGKHKSISSPLSQNAKNVDEPEPCTSTGKSPTKVTVGKPASATIVTGQSSIEINNPIPIASVKASAKQTNITNYVPKKISLNQKTKIDKTFLRLFYSDFQPFSIVEDKGFRDFVRELNPSYALPSRKTISNNLIPLAFEECKRIVQNKLKETEQICLTVDTWTSSVNEGYLAVTGHFLSNDFMLHSILLDCVQLEGSHTSSRLALEIREITDAYNLTNKVHVIVTDNAANIVSAVKSELRINHWPCFGHTLNLVVQDALGKITPLIEKCKKIVSHFKRSTTANEKLVRYQRNSGSNNPKKLLQDVCTRWNSTYFMVSRFVELQEAVRSCLGLIDNDLPVLTSEEWNSLSELCKVLKPFEQVTAKLSGDNYLTGSQIIVLTVGLQDVCSKLVARNFLKPVSDVVADLLLGLLTRFDNVEYNKLVGVSTFLDPRFKLFAFSSDKFKEHIKKHIISLVTAHISKSVASMSSIDHCGPSGASASNPTPTTQEDDELEVFGYFDSIMKNVKSLSSGSPHARAIVEVDRYLADPPLPREGDPFHWWKTQGQLYPHLSALAKKHLCFIATSVPCERIFSKTGLFINDRRTRLKPSKVREPVFLNANYKYVQSTH